MRPKPLKILKLVKNKIKFNYLFIKKYESYIQRK